MCVGMMSWQQTGGTGLGSILSLSLSLSLSPENIHRRRGGARGRKSEALISSQTTLWLYSVLKALSYLPLFSQSAGSVFSDSRPPTAPSSTIWPHSSWRSVSTSFFFFLALLTSHPPGLPRGTWTSRNMCASWADVWKKKKKNGGLMTDDTQEEVPLSVVVVATTTAV